VTVSAIRGTQELQWLGKSIRGRIRPLVRKGIGVDRGRANRSSSAISRVRRQGRIPRRGQGTITEAKSSDSWRHRFFRDLISRPSEKRAYGALDFDPVQTPRCDEGFARHGARSVRLHRRARMDRRLITDYQALVGLIVEQLDDNNLPPPSNWQPEASRIAGYGWSRRFRSRRTSPDWERCAGL